jgi:hypothetical protein
MASYGQRSVVPLWILLGMAAPLLLLMGAFETGRLVVESVQQSAVSIGALAALLVGAVWGAVTIESGRTGAWWPTLVSLLGLGAWLYLTFQTS